MIAPYNQTKRHGDFLYAPPQARAPVPRGPLRRSLRLSLQVHLRHRDVPPRLHRRYVDSRSRSASSAAAMATTSGACARPTCICSARPRTARCSSSAPTGSGATCFSRIIYGARISLTIGIVGIAVSFTLGLFFGGLAGYLGGWVDHVIQRMIEILRSLPELPLWLALSAALPRELEPDPRLLRHHDHPRPARLAGPRPRGALEAAVAARRGFREGRGTDGRLEAAHHRAPPDPELHEPPDRVGDAVDSRR